MGKAVVKAKGPWMLQHPGPISQQTTYSKGVIEL